MSMLTARFKLMLDFLVSKLNKFKITKLKAINLTEFIDLLQELDRRFNDHNRC